MRNIFKLFGLLMLATSTQLVNAATFNYEIMYPNHVAHPAYPTLDLNGLNLIKVNASQGDISLETTVTRLELVFPNASNIVAYKFTKTGNIYRALVNGAWIYKQVLVEVELPGPLEPGAPLHVRIFIVEDMNLLNNTGMSHGLLTFEADGPLVDVTPNKVADSAQLEVDDKSLTLKIYQRPVFDVMTGAQGFKLASNWFGHGERVLYVNAPFPVTDYSRYKAVAINVDTQIMPDGVEINMFSVDYEDTAGALQSTPFEDLRMLLDQAY